MQHTEALLIAEREQHQQTTRLLQQEAVQPAQQVADLQSQLTQGEQHRQSLEDKYRHARETLVHFRQAAKEQRDLVQRQHEQQSQQLQAELRQLNQTLGTKQDQLTGISRDNARLAAELSQSHAQHHKVQAEGRSLPDELAVALAAGQHAESLGLRLAERELQIEELLRGKKVIEAMAAEKEDRRQTLENELASARVSLSLQEKVIADMHAQFLSLGGHEQRSGLQTAGVGMKPATPDAPWV